MWTNGGKNNRDGLKKGGGLGTAGGNRFNDLLGCPGPVWFNKGKKVCRARNEWGVGEGCYELTLHCVVVGCSG